MVQARETIVCSECKGRLVTDQLVPREPGSAIKYWASLPCPKCRPLQAAQSA